MEVVEYRRKEGKSHTRNEVVRRRKKVKTGVRGTDLETKV